MQPVSDHTTPEPTLRLQTLQQWADHSDDLLLLLDHDGRIRLANRRAHRLLGIHAGTSLTEVLQAPRLAPLRAIQDTLWPQMLERPGRRELMLADGRRTLQLRSRPLHSSTQPKVIVQARLRRNSAAGSAAPQALRDPLTGLVNRQGFENELERLLHHARDSGQQHALFYLDLDDFKIVNDSCGHEAGDVLLKQLPQLLLPLLRADDTVARLGGDEFGVLLFDCDLANATRIAERIRDAVRAFRFAWQARSFSVGVSIGVISIDASDESIEAVMREADGACYTAKESAANGVHVVRPHELSTIRHRGDQRWAQRLRDALSSEDGFCLYFQSLHDLKDDSAVVSRHELLLRLQDRHGQPVQPGTFLSAASRHGLMPEIDRWVIEHGLAAVAPLLQGPAQGHRFGINLSARSLSDQQVLQIIQRELERHQIEPYAIFFEIQETTASLNLGSALNFMRGIREIGCGLVLDDFGSGVSSFSYLKNLPVDLIKIDGSIIDDLIDNPVNMAIVRACCEVAHCLDIATLAESVESDAQLNLLRQLNLDFAQGHVFSRPQPLSAFQAR